MDIDRLFLPILLRSVDDSFMVVITMLLGELDYGQMTELDSSSGDNVMLVKIIILLFIMMMSIVLINLIIGLAINDITTLRYVNCKSGRYIDSETDDSSVSITFMQIFFIL